MTEKLLQYIWQFQYFNPNELITEEGELLQIIHPGTINTNQGADFSDAKIKIDNTVWAGSIELHINATDWNKHKHSADKNYKNVILHVVWNNDIDFNLPFSTLVLQNKVPKILLNKYNELMNTNSFIPCEKNIHLINNIIWQSWKERMLVERLENKTSDIYQYLQKNNNHWEETCWWLMAKNFGIKLNSGAFEKTAQSIPISILAKYKNKIHQTEALLFGQAGLLNNKFTDNYPKLLQREYQYLKKKYNLQKVEGGMLFLRMRPSNFPTIRMAQLAMLVHNSMHLFSKIKESTNLKSVKKLLNLTANDYWHYHYTFDELSSFKKKNIGAQMLDNIIINTVVPLLFAYGHYNNEYIYKEKAMLWLEQIKAEKNSIINGFAILKIEIKNAYDTQALMQLKKIYCNNKRCLDCSVGNTLIRTMPHTNLL